MTPWADFITLEGHEVFVRVSPEEPKPGHILTAWHGKIENPSPEVQQLIAKALIGKAGPHIFSTRIGQIFFNDFDKFEFAGPPTLPDEE